MERWKSFCFHWQESSTGPVPRELLGSGLPPRNFPTLQLARKAPRISVWASASQPHESKTPSLFCSVKSLPAANRAGEGRGQGKPFQHRGWGFAEEHPPASIPLLAQPAESARERLWVSSQVLDPEESKLSVSPSTSLPSADGAWIPDKALEGLQLGGMDKTSMAGTWERAHQAGEPDGQSQGGWKSEGLCRAVTGQERTALRV